MIPKGDHSKITQVDTQTMARTCSLAMMEKSSRTPPSTKDQGTRNEGVKKRKEEESTSHKGKITCSEERVGKNITQTIEKVTMIKHNPSTEVMEEANALVRRGKETFSTE